MAPWEWIQGAEVCESLTASPAKGMLCPFCIIITNGFRFFLQKTGGNGSKRP